MASASTQSLHLLSIHLASAPSGLRAALSFCREDVEHWLKRAAAAGAPLAIVCGPESVDLYSTEAGRRSAFKPLLESLWSLGRNLEGVDRVRTTEASGHEVVRHLLRQATGLASTEHGLSYEGCIAEAWDRAAQHGTLCDPLCELFQLAHATADRSHAETELSAANSTRASRQIEALSAERILEEELTALRIAAANDVRASTAPGVANAGPRPSSLLPTYAASEPSSSVRIRISPFSLMPAPQRHSG
jgi:glutamyl-tRNA reductase